MIDAVDVIRFVGPQTFGRARDVVRAGLVDDAVWNADDGTVTATVTGTADDPYECRIDMTVARGDFIRPVRSTCSCPLGGDCKHVAAALLTINARALAANAGPRPEAPAPPPSDWRHDLARLAGDDEQAVTPQGTRMGLQFELRDAVPAALAARARAAGRALPAPSRTVRLGVRPVTRSDAGNWVRGQLTWGTLPYSQNRLGLGAEQHGWFMQLAALHRAGQLAGLPGESDWLHLDDFRSPLLWPLLRQASGLDIAFVTGKREGGVVLGEQAQVLLDVSRPGVARHDDAVVIGASAVLDGRPVVPGAARMVGDHGVYVFRESPEFTVGLAPTPAPVPDDQRRMLLEGTRITVPTAEVDEFLADWSPRLRGALGLVSSDGSVELPERTPPELVLTATFEPARAPRTDDRVHLHWRWHVDGRKDPVSLHGPLPDLTGLRAADDPASTDDSASTDDRAGTEAATADADVPAALEPATSTARADDATSGEPPVRPAGPGGGLDWFQDGTIDGADVAVFANEFLPELPALGVRTVVQGERLDYERLSGRPHIRVTTMPSDKHDWFDLGIIVSVNGKQIPFTPLLTALAGRQRRLKLVDNSYLSLADPAFDRLKELIDEARDLDEWEPDQPIQVTPLQAGLWTEFDLLADETSHDERWQAITAGLMGATPPGDVPVPDTVHAELRPYQHAGYAWLSFLAAHGIGGVLADDMGLGKTLQVLAMVAARRAAEPDGAPFLVVAPTSVVGNWVAEAAKFTPSLRVAAVTSTSLKDPGLVARTASQADVVVTSYALLRLDSQAWTDLPWSALVLDEAQFVKNPQSQTHRVASELQAPVKFAITGTPLENGLTDLWALFHIVAPGLLSTWTRFGDDFVKPLASPELRGEARQQLTAKLRRRIRPLMLRRTKQAVAADLPPKQEQVVRVTLDPAHRELYERTLNRERLKVLDLIDDLSKNRMIVFRSLTLLRMLALSPALVSSGSDSPLSPSTPIPSAKLDLLLDELEQLAAEGRRALVFSQFTSFLRMVSDALDERGVGYEYLDGSTRKRPQVIERFRQGTAPAFLISLKAGGFGLTLTEADTVFVLDPWWNPAAESQAVDRTHRIGQTRSVSVQRFIAEDTIEEKVLALAARKAELFATMIDDDALFADDLTADDIRSLLA
ncbi:SNF2 family DNA or RNA helicase [Curtobacterium sp. PhB142]|nr:SNF2 family DNA or RNA helicase [Curtobacterium sp. PhB142]TCM01791.1 SNF2 family DNA or RNA helicase [Curtobacterium sp. PhB134]TDW42355.1 SNF2 family DNA or RNA helicase [Curtobacterium sp. PhB42]TDW52881.1 SNF2 family DNA or RNA helicase [Curtobacterium sp. PhB190]